MGGEGVEDARNDARQGWEEKPRALVRVSTERDHMRKERARNRVGNNVNR